MPEESGPLEKLIEKDKVPPSTLAWYASPQILASVSAVVGGVITFCSAFHIVIPYSAAELAAGLGALMAIVGGGFAWYRRIRAGLDPHNDAPKITFSKEG